MPRTRIALLIAGTALLLSSLPSEAAPRPLLSDPKGDFPVAGMDVVSATVFTTGTTKKVGRRTVYTPTALNATVTMAGPVTTQVGTSVSFSMDISACGNGSMDFNYRPGSRLGSQNAFVVGCGSPGTTGTPSDYYGDSAIVKGNTVSWKLRLKDMGKDLPLGTTFRNFVVTSDFTDPAFGLFGTNTYRPLTSPEDASSKETYELR